MMGFAVGNSFLILLSNRYESTNMYNKLSIPDCCDGSDEYDTEVKCPNHCVELAAKVRKQREAEQQKLEAGLKEKNVWLEYAANKHVERLELIENLEREVKELEAKQADAQAAKDNAEKANAARSTVDTRKAQFKALRQCPSKLPTFIFIFRRKLTNPSFRKS